MNGEYIPHPQILLAGKKKVQFDIDAKKDTFFEAHNLIERNLGKSPIYEMPTALDSSLEVGPSRQHGTLQKLFKRFFSLARDLDSLTEIESLLHRSTMGQNDSTVNSLHNKKTRKEVRMNIQIGDYEVDSVILDLGLDVNIVTRQTWKNMGSPMLSCSPMQL